MTTEPLDPTKYHRFDLMNPKGKYLVVAGLMLLFLVIAPLFGLIYYKFAVNRPNQISNETQLTIESGEGLSSVAARLYELDAINSEFLFKAYVVINGFQNNIQAGHYVIPAGTSVKDLVAMLQNGTNDRRITFLEGWRAEEFATLAHQNFEKIDYHDFLRVAKDYEGRLFPDTYEFNADVDEETMINTLLENFSQKTADVLNPENLAQTNLTQDQALILASIVEREVHNQKDRPIVAGILINRWRNEELIGADATTQYAVAPLRYGCDGAIQYDITPDMNDNREFCPDAEEIPDINWWPDDLTVNELDYDSPYNTRENVGLPPTPIANPSLNAIEAVLNYAQTNYNYYLTDGEGVTHYAETLEEHNENVQRYL